MKVLNIAVIGVGVIATSKHIPSLLKRDDIRITALCDIDISKAEKAKEEFGLTDAAVYTDYKDVCTNPDIDVVHVCTPNPMHHPITMLALENGKHVHCEKPLACTYKDAKEMCDTAKAKGLKLTSGLQWRFQPATMRLKELVKEGYFGDIYYIKSQQLRGRRLPAYGVYTSKEGNGGGMLMDGGPHSIDLPMWITDNYEVESVYAMTFDKMKNFPDCDNALGPWDPEHFDVEDSGMAMIRMKNGMLIYLEVAWVCNMMSAAPGFAESICGTKAGADMVGGFGNTVRKIGTFDGKFGTETETLEVKHNNNDYDINHWIDAIQTGSEPAVLPEQAAVVTRVIEAIYKSAETGRPVVFDKDV